MKSLLIAIFRYGFLVVLLITFFRIILADDLNTRFPKENWMEITGTFEQNHSKYGAGLFIDGKITSYEDYGSDVRLKVISSQQFKTLAEKLHNEQIILSGKRLDNKFYPVRVANQWNQEYDSASTEILKKQLYQSQVYASKEAKIWSYLATIWGAILFFLEFCMRKRSVSNN